jgi:3-deoxy-D-arabino-heptulosonate 7-phosphate (DAHP) synthase
MNKERIDIFGPCAAETREQVLQCAWGVKERGRRIERASLFKPRTRPSDFEGVGLAGAPWFAEVSRMGITVGTEALLPDHVTDLIKAVDVSGGDPAKILFWLGSRNQNQHIQRGVAERIKMDAPSEVKLLIKNQPWNDEVHWLGIVDYVLGVGLPPERLILCHRGFCANGHDNPYGFRNLPDFEMAMRVKEKTGLPMLLDPSHIGGSVEKVFKVVEMASPYNFDGWMVEAHPDPAKAETDAEQQLTFSQVDKLLAIRNSD